MNLPKLRALSVLANVVRNLSSPQELVTLTWAMDGPEDSKPSVTPMPLLDTRAMSTAEIFRRFERASRAGPRRIVICVYRSTEPDVQGDFPVWIMGIDCATNERFLVKTAITEAAGGLRIHEPEEVDEATLDDLLAGWDFPPDEPARPHAAPDQVNELVERLRAGEDLGAELANALAQQKPPIDTSGMSEGQAKDHALEQLNQIVNDARLKIDTWAAADPDATGADLPDTLMFDLGETWGHADVPATPDPGTDFGQRLNQLHRHMSGLGSPTSLARFGHDGSNYLFALYRDRHRHSHYSVLFKLTIVDGAVSYGQIDSGAYLD